MFRQLVLVLVILSAQRVCAMPTGLYAPATGQLVFADVMFSGLLRVSSSTNQLLKEAEYHFPGVNALVDAQNMPEYVVYLNHSSQPQFVSPFDAGFVARPGTPISDLHLDYAIYTGAAFGPFQDGVLIEVPEPSVLALSALAICAFCRRQRWAEVVNNPEV